MNKARNSRLSMGAGILAIAILMLGSFPGLVEAGRKSVAMQVTATLGIGPGTTVTANPYAPVTSSGGASSFALVLVVLGLVTILAIALIRLGGWNLRSLLELSLGFIGWFILTTRLWVWVLDTESGAVFLNPFRLLPLLVTLSALILFYLTWRRIFFGILCAVAFNAVAILLVTFAADPANNRALEDMITMVPFFLHSHFPAL